MTGVVNFMAGLLWNYRLSECLKESSKAKFIFKVDIRDACPALFRGPGPCRDLFFCWVPIVSLFVCQGPYFQCLDSNHVKNDNLVCMYTAMSKLVLFTIELSVVKKCFIHRQLHYFPT